MRGPLRSDVEVAVIGAGFAGASIAAALARAGVMSGLVLERESLPGTHASGRNAAMAGQLEFDPILFKLAVDGVRRLCAKTVAGRPMIAQTGGLYPMHGNEDRAGCLTQLHQQGAPCEFLRADEARRRFPFLNGFDFGHAFFCATDGVVDIHALLSDLLSEARNGGFDTITDCAVEDLLLEGCVVRGLRTQRGEIRAHFVVDATGAWAGILAGHRLLSRCGPCAATCSLASKTAFSPATLRWCGTWMLAITCGRKEPACSCVPAMRPSILPEFRASISMLRMSSPRSCCAMPRRWRMWPCSAPEVERVKDELARFVETWEECRDLPQVLESPAVPRSSKDPAIVRVAEVVSISPCVRNFLYVVSKRRRLSKIESIAAQFESLSDERRGIVRAVASVASPLRPEQEHALVSALAKMLGKTVRLECTIDPDLIGGVRVRVNSTVYDGTVRLSPGAAEAAARIA